jgi:hydrogenase maturation factor
MRDESCELDHWQTLHALAAVAETSHAVTIGKVEARGLAPVVVERITGSVVPLDEPVGAPLPRICQCQLDFVIYSRKP